MLGNLLRLGNRSHASKPWLHLLRNMSSDPRPPIPEALSDPHKHSQQHQPETSRSTSSRATSSLLSNKTVLSPTDLVLQTPGHKSNWVRHLQPLLEENWEQMFTRRHLLSSLSSLELLRLNEQAPLPFLARIIHHPEIPIDAKLHLLMNVTQLQVSDNIFPTLLELFAAPLPGNYAPFCLLVEGMVELNTLTRKELENTLLRVVTNRSNNLSEDHVVLLARLAPTVCKALLHHLVKEGLPCVELVKGYLRAINLQGYISEIFSNEVSNLP